MYVCVRRESAVHGAFLQQFVALESKLAAAVTAHLRASRSHRLLLTGHSLGGGVAVQCPI